MLSDIHFWIVIIVIGLGFGWLMVWSWCNITADWDDREGTR